MKSLLLFMFFMNMGMAMEAAAEPVLRLVNPVTWSIERIHHPLRRVLVKNALEQIGVPYVWGGTTRKGFDCSGFVQYVYKKSGISIPRTASQQRKMTYTKGYLGPGDIVSFYPTNSPTRHHVGIYLGQGWFIHSPSSGEKIRLERIDSKYYLDRFVGAWSPFTTRVQNEVKNRVIR